MPKPPPEYDPDRRPRPKPRPAPKKKRSDDDPPPVRLRPGEEEDYEEDDDSYDLRPKGRGAAEFDARGRRVNQRAKRLWQNISTFITLVVVVGLFSFAAYLIFWAKKPVPPDPDLMAFVPARTSLLYGGNIREAQYNEKFRAKLGNSLDNGVPPLMAGVMKQLNLRMVDLDRVIIAADSYVPARAIAFPRGVDGSDRPGVTAIFKLRKTAFRTKEQRDRNDEEVDIEFSRADLQAATRSEERSHNGKRYFAGRSFDGTPYYYHGASAHVLVVAENERNLQELLNKPDDVIVVGGPIKRLADQLGGENFWYAQLMRGLAPEEHIADTISYGGRVLGPGQGDEVAFGYGGGVYNHGVDFTYVTYLNDAEQAKALKAAADAIKNTDIAPIYQKLAAAAGDLMTLPEQFTYEELANTKFRADGNLFIYTTRYRTWIWEDMFESPVKVGNQSFTVPYPFFRGPFALLERQANNSFVSGCGPGMFWRALTKP